MTDTATAEVAGPAVRAFEGDYFYADPTAWVSAHAQEGRVILFGFKASGPASVCFDVHLSPERAEVVVAVLSAALARVREQKAS